MAAAAPLPPPTGVVDPASRIRGGTIEDLDGAPCDAMLAHVDPSRLTDAFVVLQLIRPPDDDGVAPHLNCGQDVSTGYTSYVVHSQWGTTGDVGQTLGQKFYSLAKAKSCFENEFRLKTGLEWKDRTNPPVPNKYRFVAQDFARKRGGFAGGLWQYWVADFIDGKGTGWYDYADSTQVERLYQEYASNGTAQPDLSQRILTSGHFSYLVDFVQMMQTNVAHPGRKSRKIRRVDFAGGTFNAPMAPAASNQFHGASAPHIVPPPMIHGGAAPRNSHGVPPPALQFHGASAPPAPPSFLSTFRTAVRGGGRGASSNPSSSSAGGGAPRDVLRYEAPRSLADGIPPDALGAPPSTCDLTEECAICHCPLGEDGPCVALTACGHAFHRECIRMAFEAKPQCPVCRVSIGQPQGKSPSGTMAVSVNPMRCHGYAEDTLVVCYDLPRGTQRDYHEHPGRGHGGKRATAYLPANDDGRALLRRLKFAFVHGLSFAVGTSFTTGIADQCTWASVHHKTSLGGGPRCHGYPDPGYFDNCNGELDGLGVPPASELNDDGSAKK